MNLTQLSLSRRTVLFAAVAALAFAGMQAYASLPRDENPTFLIRTAVVSVAWPGASAERVERLVAEPLEEALEVLPGTAHVRSTVEEGRAVVYYDVEERLPGVEPSWTEMREAVADVRLPPGAVGPFVNDDFGAVFGILVAVTGEGYGPDELRRAAEALRRRVLALENSDRVQLDGVPERRVYVEVDPARLAASGLSAPALAAQIQPEAAVGAGGDVVVGGLRVPVQGGGGLASAADVAALAVRLPGGGVATVGDVARVREGFEEPHAQRVRFNGRPAVTVGISMAATGNLTEFGPAVLEAVAETQAEMPAGLAFDLVTYQPEIVERLTGEFVSSLVQSVLIVIAVLLLSLGFRTGLIVASTVPTTIVVGFIGMQAFGLTINQISLTALILALGLLVDNAIVVAEKILSDTERGAPLREAALDAARTLALPLFVSSATTSAALLPTYLAESSTSEFAAALFEVLTVCLFTSWVLALTLVPVLCVLFLKTGRAARPARPVWRVVGERLGWVRPLPAGTAPEGTAPADPFESAGYRRYRGVLMAALARPWRTLAAFVAVLVGSLALFGAVVPQKFFPDKSDNTFTVELDLPRGTSVDETDRVVADLERFFADSLAAEGDGAERPGVTRWAAYIGSSAPRYQLAYSPKTPRESYAYVLARATRPEHQPELFARIEGHMNRAHPGVVARAQKVRNGPPLDYPVELRLSGDDPAALEAAAAEVRARLREVGGLTNVGTNWGPRQPTLDVAVDGVAARRAGLSSADVSLSVRAALDGAVIGAVQREDDLVPVVLRSTDARTGPAALDGLEVYAPGLDRPVPFAQVARAEVVYAPGVIERYDGRRTVTVRADIPPSAGAFVTPLTVQGELAPFLAEASAAWPPGIAVEYGGDVELSADSGEAIGAKGPLALLVIVLLLVLQFNALRPVGIVLATLPFSFVGVALGLAATGYGFGFFPLLGTIALVGIVINNGVLLLDGVDAERARGVGPEQAVLHAAQQRLRPVVLTTATTVAGLVPLWLAGSVLFAPLGVAMLFGLVFATAITPLLVPVLYALVYRLRFAGVAYDPDPPLAPAAEPGAGDRSAGGRPETAPLNGRADVALPSAGGAAAGLPAGDGDAVLEPTLRRP